MNTEASIEQYFSNRFNQSVSRDKPPQVDIPEVDGFAKQRSLEKASAEKIAALEAITQRRAASREANKGSWVAQSGVDSDGVAASAINLAAQVADGASTIVGGTIASLPDAIAAASAESGMSAADTEAFNRYQRGTATPEDIQLLSQPKLHATQTDTPEARLETAANLAVNPLPSKLELFEKSIQHRKTQQGILKAFNVNSIVQHDAGDRFVEDLGKDFQPAWDQVKQGATNIFQQGDVAGTGDLVSGLGKLVFNAGEATLNNKEGALGFVANNIPQLALGAFGKLGMAGMTASNVGYAADNYQQGMKDYQDKHGGDLPPPDVRNKMALQAASLALAEHVGDTATLGIAGKGTKDVARASFKQSLLNVGKAAGEGVLSEAPTEGFQTYMEGEVTGKPVEAKDIYTGAVIGGVVGSGMAGGGRVIAEGAKATPEHAEKRAQDRQVIEKLDKAIETGDVSEYLDSSKPTYNPAKAAAVLFGNSQRESTSSEAKTENLAKAQEILSGLEEQRATAAKELAHTTPEGIQQNIDKYQAQADLFAESNPAQSEKFSQYVAALKEQQAEVAANPTDKNYVKAMTNQVNTLDRHIKAVREVTDQIGTLVKPATEDVAAAIEQADAPASEASQNAAQRVITLSMAHPDAVTSEMVDRLVSNAGNALTEQQRDYLRNTSEARIAANALKGLDTVHSEVLIGDSAKGQLGITDYQAKIGKAILGGNQKQADRYQEMLDTFTEHHAQKAQLFDQAFQKAQSTGETTQLVPTKNGGWQVADKPFSTIADLRAAGGVLIHKNSNSTKNGKTGLLSGIQAESRALISANKQLKAAYALKFTPATTVNSVTQVAHTTESASTVDQGQLQSNPEGTVDSTDHVDNSVTESTTTTVQPDKEAQAAPAKASKLRVPKFKTPAVKPAKSLDNHRSIDVSKDSVLQAIAKLGGLSIAAMAEAGIDISSLSQLNAGRVIKSGPNEGKMSKPALRAKMMGFNLPVYSRSAGLDLDAVREQLTQAGRQYFPSDISLSDFGAALRDIVNGAEHTPVGAELDEDAIRANAEARQRDREEFNAVDEAANEESGFNDLSTPEAQELANHVMEAVLAGDPEQLASVLEATPLTEDEINEQLQHAFAESDAESIQDTDGSTDSGSHQSGDNQEQTNSETLEGSQETQGTEVTQESDPVTGELSVFQKATEFAGKELGKVVDAAKGTQLYQKLNLVKEFLVQSAGKGEDKRPLVAQANFLTAWAAGDIKLEYFLGGRELSVEQQGLLEDFKNKAIKWLPMIQASLVKGAFNKTAGVVKDSPEFYFNDPIQFLVELVDGKADVDENVKVAIAQAAYGWVAENAGNPSFNTREQVKAMFGVADHEEISMELFRAVQDKGGMEKAVINAMGQRVTQALGLKANDKATQDFLPRLQSSLGAHVMKLLLDQGILERNEVPAQIIKDGLPGKQAAKTVNVDQGFLRLARNPGETLKERTLKDVALGIQSASKGTQGILTKLFGVVPDLIEPSWTPIKSKQTTTKNTDQKVPAKLKKIIDHENAVGSRIRQDMWGLMNAISKDAFLNIAGAQDIDPDTMHKLNMEGTEAGNDSLDREYERAMEYFQMVEDKSPEGLGQLLYFEHTVWKQQRVGIATNMVNPQTSKLHRWMLARPEWETEVSSTDAAMMDNFRLRVMEGLGTKTDKQDNVKSLAEFSTLFDPASVDPKAVTLRAAIAAIRTGVIEGHMTPELQQDIVAGVKAGGEKMHSLDALMAMATYEEAKTDAGEFKFTVNMMGEVDGVTNGPMLSHLALGAAANPDALYELLNKGGFFRAQDGVENYNVYRGIPGHKDLYETTIGSVIQNVVAEAATNPKINALLPAMEAITGTLVDSAGNVQKAGRNIIKTPLTAMIFGSAVEGAIRSMFEDFVLKTYDGFETLAELEAVDQETKRIAYIAHINTLLAYGQAKEMMPNVGISELLSFEFSKEQTTALERAFNATLGDAVTKTMEMDFSVFMGARKVLNSTAQATFALFDAVAQGVREKYVAELMDAGELPFAQGKTDRTPRTDLTVTQGAALATRLQDLQPIVHTLMSKESDADLSAGLHISKSSRKISTDPAYRGQVKFGKPMPDGKVNFTTAAYQRFLAAPGVAMVPMMMHSLDSFISHMAAAGTQVLNIHDAHGTGLKHFTRTAQRLNAATWNAVLNYSPASEIRDSWLRTLTGIDAMLQSGEDTGTAVQGLKQAMQELAVKHKGKIETILQTLTDNMYLTAYSADRVKYETLSQMTSVDQYALEGGNYAVTEADRQEAANRLKDLVGMAPADVLKMLERITAAVLQAKPAQVAQEMQPLEIEAGDSSNQWGALGQSVIPSNPEIEKRFKAKPVMSGTEALRVAYANLDKNLSPRMAEFYKALLVQVSKVMPGDLTVRYVTPDTLPSDIAEHVSGARGWYVDTAKGNIYVLSSEFKHSGLTAEVLIHEIVHGVLTKTVEKASSPEVRALIQDLENLRGKAQAFVMQMPAEQQDQYAAALSNVHELIAWGMSNQAFQKNVLNKISMESKTLGSQLISGMQHFINTVVGILFKGSPKSKQQIAQNGMTVLLSNVSGLFNAVSSKEEASHKTFAMASSPLQNYTTMDIYDALATSAVSPSFDAHLRGLLTSIRLKAYGAYGSFMAARMLQTAHDPLSVWSEALRDGAAPLAKELRVPGIRLNDQVAFVADQVYAVMTTALTDNEGYSTVAARELAKLYSEVAAKVKPSDFYEGDWSQANAQDRQYAEDTHAAIFKMEKVDGDRTDHLARFAALGLAHPKFNALLHMATKQEDHSLKNKTFSQRIEAIFALVLDWVNGLLTHTYAGQAANVKLTALVDHLIQIEDRKKARLAKQANATDYFGKVEDHTKEMLATALKKVAAVAGSAKVQNSSNALIAAGGSVVRLVANNQVDAFLNVLADYRNKNWKQNLGITAGLLNNVVGPKQVIETMLRGSKHIESQRHDIITMTRSLVKEMYADEGENLSDAANAAVSSVLLRTGAHVLLDHFDMAQLQDLVANKDSRLKAIKQFEDQLTPFKAFKKDFIYQAKALGYYLVTGQSKTEFGVLNAKNISRLTATNNPWQITEKDSTAAEPIIDVLVSLYAMNYSDPAELNAVAKLMATENARTDGNGVAFSLSLHQRLNQEAKEKLFVDADALMIKGYTPDIYNPNTNIKVSNLADGQDLIGLGYTKESLLWKDPKDPDQQDRHIYVLRDGGLLPYQTGIMSQTGMAHKGSLQENSNVDLWTETGQRNLAAQQRLNSTKRAAMRKAIDSNVDFDPSKEKQNFMVPLMNGKGEVVNWRYMMHSRTKDTLLEREGRSEQLLGVLAGSVYDKQQTDSQNRKAVEALHEEFKTGYAKNADSFVSVSANAPDPVNQEIYRLLPDVTKQAIKEIWGQDGMMVPVNMVDIMFGYRKLTLSSVFDKVVANRKAKKNNPTVNEFAGINVAEHAMIFGVEWALKSYARSILGMDEAAAAQYANRGGIVVRRAERGWQEAVKLTKDLIVVRTGTVMAGNILSNISLLKLHGVPWLDILHHHRVAMRAATSYQDDHEELFRLKTREATGHTQGNNAKVSRRIIELEDSIARNPVKKLIDQGLMPTIVEDVETSIDPYSYKTALTKKLEKYTNKINPTVLSIAKTAVVAQDTQLYKTFSQITQLSDFVARYTLYQHLVNRKVNPMTEEDALHEASESFINYDIPMHRMMQYTDDTGLTMFTKYFLGIQRVLARTTKEHPLRTLMTLAVDNFFNSADLVTDSSALFHLGHDPIRSGAAQLPGAIWNISTIQGAMSLIK